MTTARKVLRMGDPRLLQPSEPVAEFDTPELHELVADMFETMEAERGTGLAAVQIGVLLRVVVFRVECPPGMADCEPVPDTVLINPQIEPLTDACEEAWEGCLSVPGMRGAVRRCTRVRYRGFDQWGHPVERHASGYHARVVQHECDHIDGILYPRRIRDLRKFGFLDELLASGVMVGGALPCEDTAECAPDSEGS
jgi:peptide deformylase